MTASLRVLGAGNGGGEDDASDSGSTPEPICTINAPEEGMTVDKTYNIALLTKANAYNMSVLLT